MKTLEKRIHEIEALAVDEGLDFFPIIFETVNDEIMLEACCYGLPTRMSHWSHGRSYEQQKIFGKMGLSRVYEIIFNNNPSYAFLMDNNSDAINLMVAAHCYGHSHVFKNNCMFHGSDTGMVYRAAERAVRVDDYIEQYGIDKVEHLIDIGYALSKHIDWNKGVFREKYPKKQIVGVKRKSNEFDDIFNIGKQPERYIKTKVIGDRIPPHPEQDLLWFLINYAQLEDWERDILEIIREESYYFYPIIKTTVLNEGLASFTHSELMTKYSGLTPDEHMEFAKVHSGVINPGNPFNINPYYLGFKIFTNIREKWDKMHEAGESKATGMQKVFQVSSEEDDASFLRNYLTKELATELGMFNYGYKLKRKPGKKLTKSHQSIELKDRDLNKIIEHIIRPTINYGVPMVTINDIDGDTLVMEHKDDLDPLDIRFTEKTMGYIFELWGGAIELSTVDDDDEEVTYVYDESGFSKL